MPSIFLIFILATTTLWGQRDDVAYINKYKSIAIKEMKQYGIPASITLAQGILESAGGTSELASKSNNHFGIKCHNSWDGDKVYHDDDKKGECFRKYDDPEESFRDHSLFLSTRSRYAFLFELERDDYKGWAKGLRKAGYATNKKYADRLIDLIEKYNLHQFDKVENWDELSLDDRHIVMVHLSDLKYIEVVEGDTYEKIALEFELDVEDILEYNDLRWDDPLPVGEKLFIEKKNRKGYEKYYTVKMGDTMHSIAQKFGMRLEYLYKKNLMSPGSQPLVGQKMHLRRTIGKKFLWIF